MKTVTCPKCNGRGEIPVDDPEAPCEVEIILGHETISCYASRQHPGQPHMALLAQPCAACGAYDEHHESCVVYPAEPEESSWYPICWWRWETGDVTVTRTEEGAGQAWRNRYQPDSPWAVAA